MNKSKNFFKDASGKTVILQRPNLPAWITLITLALSIVTPASLSLYFQVIAFGWALTWSYLEVKDGASPFRKSLGALVMVCVLVLTLLRITTI